MLRVLTTENTVGPDWLASKARPDPQLVSSLLYCTEAHEDVAFLNGKMLVILGQVTLKRLCF